MHRKLRKYNRGERMISKNDRDNILKNVRNTLLFSDILEDYSNLPAEEFIAKWSRE